MPHWGREARVPFQDSIQNGLRHPAPWSTSAYPPNPETLGLSAVSDFPHVRPTRDPKLAVRNSLPLQPGVSPNRGTRRDPASYLGIVVEIVAPVFRIIPTLEGPEPEISILKP